MPNNLAQPYLPLDPSSAAVEVNTASSTPRNTSVTAAPPMQYTSFVNVLPEQKSVDPEIDRNNKTLEALMKAIAENIKKIHNSNVRNVLSDALIDDIERIPQLRNAISENLYEALCSKECCCILCGVTLSLTAVSAAVGALSAFMGGLFGATCWNTSYVLTGLEYGGIAGGVTGTSMSLVWYLKGLYTLVQLARQSSEVAVVQNRLQELRQQYQAPSHLTTEMPSTPQSGRLYDIGL